MDDLDRELNRKAAAARLGGLFARGAPVTIRPGHTGPDIGPWLRRAMGAAALTVASAASMAAAMPAGTPVPANSSALTEAMQLGSVNVVVGGKTFETLHPMERVRLCKELARSLCSCPGGNRLGVSKWPGAERKSEFWSRADGAGHCRISWD